MIKRISSSQGPLRPLPKRCEDYVIQGQAANPSDRWLVTVILHHQHYIHSRLESKNLIVVCESRPCSILPHLMDFSPRMQLELECDT